MTDKIFVTLDSLKAKGWTGDRIKISKKFAFASFGDAFHFMAQCVPAIEKLDHHPEWLNIYNNVTVKLTTHDTSCVTAKDIELAGIMDTIAATLPSQG